MVIWLDAVLALAALAAALSMRPWRLRVAAGLPWPWLAWAAVMPVLWSADRLAAMPVAQPLSGACLLMLMMGWPLAMLALLPVAAVAALGGGLDAAEALHRMVWLGVVPASIALALGAAIRRLLARHLFVYILGRGFIATAMATVAAGAAALLVAPPPGGLGNAELLLGRWLAAWGDAWLAGMLVAVFVAFRPQWLATYADRLYLPTGR